jgi:hypothetical protein
MRRLLGIAVFSFMFVCLTGCSRPEEDDVLPQDLKIGDLAPSGGDRRPGGRPLRAASLNVYVVEIPADNVRSVDEIWQMLYIQPVRFNDYDAFRGNRLSVGFGQARMWGEVTGLLHAAGGKKAKTVSLLLEAEGQPNDLSVVRLRRKQTVFYVSGRGTMEGATLGPGGLALRIKAEKVPGLRGLCNVSVAPVFPPPMRSPIPALDAQAKAGGFVFTSAGFGLRMGPGDFFLLGPERYIDDGMTLASVLFSKPEGSVFFDEVKGGAPERKPAIRTFLVVCTGINY